MRVFLGVIVVLGVIAAGLTGLFFYGKSQFEAAGPAPAEGAETIVVLDRGMGLKAIDKRLEDAGVIAHPGLFEVGVRFSGNGEALKAGEYAIPARASMREIMEQLAAGRAILHRLTVPEGYSVAQVLDLVNADEALTGEITETPEEGRLLPETYSFQRGTTRDALIRQMLDAKEEVLEELWENRADALPFDTRYQALTLASIVEKETGVPEERAKVASVFINRLKKGIRLQSDPTVIYPITKGKALGRRIKQSELASDNPYNTYVHRGLPPTPICNPGRASLEAVLNPPDTDYYYFVANGSGGHAFARTLEEHNANVAAWRRIQRDRGMR